MTHSPAMAESGPQLLWKKMWDLNKHMKGAHEEGGVLLKEHKQANFSKQKKLQETNSI